MAGFQCPFCSAVMAVTPDTQRVRHPSFSYSDESPSFKNLSDSCLNISFYRCPHCKEYTVLAKGIGSAVKDVNIAIRPQSQARKYPDYIPLACLLYTSDAADE